MASVNKAIIVGYLGQDPTTRYMTDGSAVANISVATSETWKDKATGEKKEATEWHRVTFYGKLAEIVGQYLKKGSLVYIEGKLQTRKWEDKGGVERYTTEIRADVMKMLDGRHGDGEEKSKEREPAPAHRPAGDAKKNPAAGFGDMDDDIPF